MFGGFKGTVVYPDSHPQYERVKRQLLLKRRRTKKRIDWVKL